MVEKPDSGDNQETQMKRTLISRLNVLIFGIAIAASAGAAAGVIYCPAGFYCNEIYEQCLANGVVTEHGCAMMRDRCYADACRAS